MQNLTYFNLIESIMAYLQISPSAIHSAATLISRSTKSFRSCLLCETVGIVYLSDIEVLPKKDKLSERLKKNPIVKRYQLQNYAKKEKKILPETNSQGYVKSIIEYYVMGQNVTTMSVLETSDALLNRDASKFASILKNKVARCY